MKATLKSIPFMIIMLLKAVLFIPIIIFVIWFNYTVDPSALFHGDKYELSIANALLDGYSILQYEKLDERQINTLHIANSEEPMSVAIIGSSRGLQIGEDLIENRPFYNYGMISAAFIDYCNLFYTMVKEDRVPDNTVIVLDPWIFYTGPDYTDHRSDLEMYQEFLSLGLGMESSYVPPDNTEIYQALYSLSHFQATVRYYLKERQLEEKPQQVIGDLMSFSTELKKYDGTIVYGEAFRNRTQDEIDFDALSLANIESSSVHAFGELRKDEQEMFIKFIEYILETETNLIFMMTPYHPIVYDKEKELIDIRPGMFQVEDYIHEIGREYDIPVIGSYDPAKVGCDNSDFYDHIHVTAEGISKFIAPLINELESDNE